MAEETLLRRGPEREDERFAMIALMVVASQGGKAKLEDFLPSRRKLAQTDDEIRDLCMMLNATHGGEVR